MITILNSLNKLIEFDQLMAFLDNLFEAFHELINSSLKNIRLAHLVYFLVLYSFVSEQAPQ
jgi:hypothetical protein